MTLTVSSWDVHCSWKTYVLAHEVHIEQKRLKADNVDEVCGIACGVSIDHRVDTGDGGTHYERMTACRVLSFRRPCMSKIEYKLRMICLDLTYKERNTMDPSMAGRRLRPSPKRAIVCSAPV